MYRIMPYDFKCKKYELKANIQYMKLKNQNKKQKKQTHFGTKQFNIPKMKKTILNSNL